MPAPRLRQATELRRRVCARGPCHRRNDEAAANLPDDHVGHTHNFVHDYVRVHDHVL
jgi:hypothetical protein